MKLYEKQRRYSTFSLLLAANFAKRFPLFFYGVECDFFASLRLFCCSTLLLFSSRDLTAPNNYRQPMTWICLRSLHSDAKYTVNSFFVTILMFVSVTLIIFVRTIALEFVHLFQLKVIFLPFCFHFRWLAYASFWLCRLFVRKSIKL